MQVPAGVALLLLDIFVCPFLSIIHLSHFALSYSIFLSYEPPTPTNFTANHIYLFPHLFLLAGSSLSSGSHRFKRKVDPAYARRTRPHNTPTHMHLARSAEVVYTSKRDRLANPLVDPDDRNRAMGWNLPLGVGGPVGDGSARGMGRESASCNPGLTTIRLLRVTASPRSVAPVSDPIKADKSAPHVGKRARREQRRRTVSEWHGQEEPSRLGTELSRGSGSGFEGKGRTISIGSSKVDVVPLLQSHLTGL
ncbi:hypothetical protein CVT25_001201 [Psilocybe cyanescens]|uniref:Uncharacterized protein n=1 Tax=Psilocybe cyanescens TaxID=93625 RepID=A0A409XS89_PSICY|nr:hypothetical protein CVT25_001201 [Psilocybe cyanescens]